ncbi:MAG: hypothetical protein ABI481_09720 [Pyrinomonadaceae bacterium]
MRILNAPKPPLPADFGTLDAQGATRLTVTFLASGEIGKILPVTALTNNLTELAVEAAGKIKFAPKISNGEAVSVVKTIEYLYGLPYSGWQVSYSFAPDAKADAVLQRAVQSLGGEKYLNVKTQIGRGKYSLMRDGAVLSFQNFTDVIVYPDKERTDFKGVGSKTVQTNVGNTGWVFDGDQQLVKAQDEKQIENFKRGIRTSLDHLLRGHWRGEGELTYVGKRPATLGKRNEVIKLIYKDGIEVEFEFAADDGLPQKGSYKRLNADNEEIKEEDRYAQFVDVDGIKTPFIIDRFTGSTQTSRINYQTVEFNKPVPDSVFAKPANAKGLKDLKL